MISLEKMSLEQGAMVIVPDPYLAQMLSVQDEKPGEYIDIYTWASQRTGKQRPNLLDLFEIYRAASKRANLPHEPLSPEVWDLARRLGEDWEELLAGTLSYKEAWKFWSDLREHRLVVETFRMEEPPWLESMPFPRRSFATIKEFWERLKVLLEGYEEEMAQRRLAFGEKSLQEVLAKEERWEGLVFLHFYGTSRLLEALLAEAPRRGAKVQHWDIRPLRSVLPEVWGDYSSHSEAPLKPPPLPRPITLFRRTSPIEVVEGAAQHILAYRKKYPEAHIGVWCESSWVPLLRYYLREIETELSPERLPLRESTEVGKHLYEQLSANKLPSDLPLIQRESLADLEKWVVRLYETFQEGIARPEVQQLLLEILNMPSPHGMSPSAGVRVWIGDLPQLAGGRYDALFMIMPPAEPLGSWSRPSLWLSSLRQKFSPRQKHQQLAWRLLTVLLWGSKECFLWRQSDEAYRTPLEDLLEYGKSLGLADYFSFSYEEEPSRNGAGNKGPLTAPEPIAPSAPIHAEYLTPSQIATFLECPRRYYWNRVLPPLPTHEVQALGLLQHRLLEKSLEKGGGRARPLRYWLHQLSRRKLFYRLSRLFYKIEIQEGKDLQKQKRLRHSIPPLTFKLLRPNIARAGIPLLYVFHKALCPAEKSSSPPPKFPHFLRACPGRIAAYVEQELYHQSFKGRADLIIEAEGKRILIDYKSSSLEDYAPKLHAVRSYIGSVLSQWEPLPDPNYKITLQVCLYMHLLDAKGLAVDEAYVLPLWWRPKTKKDFRLWHYLYAEVKMVWGDGVWNDLASAILQRQDYPMTPDRGSCEYCDFAILCGRLT